MVLVDKNNFLESIVNKRNNAMDEFTTKKFESFVSELQSCVVDCDLSIFSKIQAPHVSAKAKKELKK